MRRGITGKITGVHAEAGSDFHVVGHGRAFIMTAGRFRILTQLDVRHHHVPRVVHIIAVETRSVIHIFSDDSIRAGRRVLAFPARRQLRNTDQLAALVKIRALFAETNLNGRDYRWRDRRPNTRRCRGVDHHHPARRHKRRRPHTGCCPNSADLRRTL